ncbi:hypothetical protein ACFWTE_19550 [Nocardiopsis sp. NPDC058631]|uniref:hypothetical protein n=1 Tax=Nocardiopsis sp. NPDC058631 TaxID=3346566 RepID=UPI00364B3B6C
MFGSSPSAFVVTIAATLIACLGLVHDGAQMLRTKTWTTVLAHEAARAGAQHLDPEQLRAGAHALEPAAARTAAQAHARAGGGHADVSVSADTVTVTVTVNHHPTVLAVLGDVRISSRATAIAHTP